MALVDFDALSEAERAVDEPGLATPRGLAEESGSEEVFGLAADGASGMGRPGSATPGGTSVDWQVLGSTGTGGGRSPGPHSADWTVDGATDILSVGTGSLNEFVQRTGGPVRPGTHASSEAGVSVRSVASVSEADWSAHFAEQGLTSRPVRTPSEVSGTGGPWDRVYASGGGPSDADSLSVLGLADLPSDWEVRSEGVGGVCPSGANWKW